MSTEKQLKISAPDTMTTELISNRIMHCPNGPGIDEFGAYLW